MEDHGGKFTDWLYGGLDFSQDGVEGLHCINSLSMNTRFWETLVIGGLAIFEIIWGCRKLEFNLDSQICDNEDKDFVLSSNKNAHGVQFNCVLHSVKEKNGVDKSKIRHEWPLLKRLLLVVLCLTFGVEIGYKLANRSLIYLLNPCHILTITQIYLLSANHEKRPKVTAAVFRVHLYLLSGAMLAMLFPVLEDRNLPFETSIYWIQHTLMYIIPLYLIGLGKPFTPEHLHDIRWPILSIGIGFFYHFFVLQPIGMMSQVNLNQMLCPASSDPFSGPHYRKWATIHQHFYVFLHGKLYWFISARIIQIVSLLRSFCVAMTLSSWKWTINLCCKSAAVCSRYYTFHHPRSGTVNNSAQSKDK